MRVSWRRFRVFLRPRIVGKLRRVVAEFSILWRIHILLRLFPKESTRVFLATLVLGGVCGWIAVAFHGSLGLTLRKAEGLVSAAPSSLQPFFVILLPGVAAWIAGAFLVVSRLPAAGSGIPQVKAALAGKAPLAGLRVGIAKVALCVVQIGGGASLGREGPTVQICSSVVPRLLRVFGLPAMMFKRFLPVASAAGIAAAFNTPVAAVTFVVEELVGASTATAMTGIVIAAAIAAIEEKVLLGGLPMFHTTSWTFGSLASLPSFLVLGMAAGFLGVWFQRGLLSLRAWFRGLSRLSIPLRMALGGLIAGAATWIGIQVFHERGIAGPGYSLMESALGGSISIQACLGMMPLKFLATLASYSSGGVGGIFTPVLAVGSMLGGLVGALHGLLPWTDGTPLGAFALVGMGAFFAAVIRAPITSVLIICELTGDYGLILPLMLANMVSFVISRRMALRPIYDALLHQDGIDLEDGAREQSFMVGELCTRSYRMALHIQARRDLVFEEIPMEGALILVDEDGSCVGLLELPLAQDDDSLPLLDQMTTQARLRESDDAIAALSLMSHDRQRWLPVVDADERPVGLFDARLALGKLADNGIHKR
ncbi:MAG TPA: chloride channel protein [Fibrobacteria bacterium]|nr:chloride channel protein [Fibrobacteria bacterium]HOX51532.1 chloride channel protein [Fibrobacteria bacterium]